MSTRKVDTAGWARLSACEWAHSARQAWLSCTWTGWQAGRTRKAAECQRAHFRGGQAAWQAELRDMPPPLTPAGLPSARAWLKEDSLSMA